MFQYSQVQYVKRQDHYSVILYYSKNGLKFRPKTGVQVAQKNLLPAGKISSKHPNLEQDLETIHSMQSRIENLVKAYYNEHGTKPPVVWLENEFEKPYIEAGRNIADIFAFWDAFKKAKEETVRNEGTMNKYKNMKVVVESFAEKKNFRLTFDNLTQSFFNELTYYMVNEREHGRSNKQDKEESIPEKGLSNSTTITRLKDFLEYLRYCKHECNIRIEIEKVQKYMSTSKYKLGVRQMSRNQKWELTLTVDELYFVINLLHFAQEFWDSLSDNQKRYLDILIFMCLQGTAPIDTKAINKMDIKNDHIIKDRSKTGNEFKVELDPIAKEILERNGYNLQFTDQTLNEELKRIFVTIFELYAQHYESQTGKKYEMICTQKYKKGDIPVYIVQHKAMFVELMTGRRTFLTNLGAKANQMGIKSAMTRAGHVKIETTLGYIQDIDEKETKDLFGLRKIA